MLQIKVNGLDMSLREEIVDAVLEARGIDIFNDGYRCGLKKALGESSLSMTEEFNKLYCKDKKKLIKEYHHKGYPTYKIAEMLDVTEHEVVSVIFPGR